jgi:hypothetical protein
MWTYILIALALTIVLIGSFLPAFQRRHPPTHCRCGKVAIVLNDTRTRGWCAGCHIRHLRQLPTDD